jgi:thiamine pyrophosphate-dependent acetolactate synthase large subunit-like protein/nitrite reductase/ring-hydroxylating ferredoxin subunit
MVVNKSSGTAVTEWHKVAEVGELGDERIKTVAAGVRTLCLVHYQGQYAAMENRCPHQGGPLGEGSIEPGVEDKCWIRCPWHGWDFDPLTGKSPGAHDDGQEMFPVETRADGIYVGISKKIEHKVTVSDIMAQTMTNWGVKYVFGIVGHSNLGLAEALRHEEVKGNLTFIGVRHEGAAAFAASGYAKLTGKPAACLGIAGPGATNLLTGLWDAKVDRAPILALAGQVNTQVLGPGAFQEIDLATAFEPVSVFNQTVLPSSNHAELMSLALKNAIVHRDVANLIFPDEVQVIPAAERAMPSSSEGRISSPKISADSSVISQAIELIEQSRRPLIIVGYGARDSMREIKKLAERLCCPVVTTFKAKGQMADSHHLAAGVLGRSGTPIASWFMNGCDLQIVFGASFSNHTGIEKKKTTIQVDFDRMALGKFHPVELPVWGEIGITVNEFLQKLPLTLVCADQTEELSERWSLWRSEKQSRTRDNRGHGLNSAWIFEVLSELVPENAVIAVDVGNNTYSFGRYFETKGSQRVLMSGYLGSIGFSFPAAMGAWAATQCEKGYLGCPVFSISGDGGFGQYMADFTTAVKYNMNITHILLNNSELGKISKEQMAGNWEVWQTSLHNPSFAEYAEICGGKGIKVTDEEELRQAIIDASNYQGPGIVEIITDVELV